MKAILQRIAALLERLDFAPGLLQRIAMAGLFLPDGWNKLNNLGTVTEYFTSLGIPMPGVNAMMVSLTQLVCGTALLFGVFTRLSAVPLFFSMIVAVLSAKAHLFDGKPSEIKIFTDIFRQEESIYAFVCLALVFLGPGSWSLDTLVAKQLGLGTPSKDAPRKLEGPSYGPAK